MLTGYVFASFENDEQAMALTSSILGEPSKLMQASCPCKLGGACKVVAVVAPRESAANSRWVKQLLATPAGSVRF